MQPASRWYWAVCGHARAWRAGASAAGPGSVPFIVAVFVVVDICGLSAPLMITTSRAEAAGLDGGRRIQRGGAEEALDRDFIPSFVAGVLNLLNHIPIVVGVGCDGVTRESIFWSFASRGGDAVWVYRTRPFSTVSPLA